MVAELREEIARLKGLKGRRDIKPSGMEQGTTPGRGTAAGRRGRGKSTPGVSVEQQTLLWLTAPAGSRFKGYEDFLVQDLVLHGSDDPLSPRTLGHAGGADGRLRRCHPVSQAISVRSCAVSYCRNTTRGKSRWRG